MIPPKHPIFTGYMTRLDRKRVMAGTRYNAEKWLGRFEIWCLLNEIDPLTATPDDLDRWMDHLGQSGYADGSIGLARIQIKAAYSYAHKRGVVPADPTIDLFPPIRPDVEPKTFTNEELRSILRACQTERDSLIFNLLAYTGMRRAEVRNLKWEDIDLPHSTITVRAGKGAKLRLVPIHAALGEVLSDATHEGSYVIGNAARDEPLQDTSWDFVFQPVMKRAGVVGTAHMFRKTLSSVLTEAGVPGSYIDQIGGWSARSVRERHYLRTVPSVLIDAIHKAYANDPISDWKPSRKRNA